MAILAGLEAPSITHDPPTSGSANYWFDYQQVKMLMTQSQSVVLVSIAFYVNHQPSNMAMPGCMPGCMPVNWRVDTLPYL